MQKLFLILIFSLLIDNVVAQQPVNEQLFIDKRDVIAPIKKNKSFKTTAAEPQALWLNFSEAVINEFNGGKYWPMPLWPDSTVLVTNTNAAPLYYDIHGFVSVLDPVSSLISNYVKFQQNLNNAEDWFDRNKRYKVDSVRFYYSYENYKNSVDTLFVHLILPGSTAFSSTSINNFPYNGESLKLVLVDYDHVNNKPSGTNIIQHTILLKNQDTVSLPNLKEIVLPVDAIIPVDLQNINNKIAIAISYKPGHSYKINDTLVDQSTNPIEIHNKLNLFRLLTFEESYLNNTSHYPLSYYEKTLNQGGVATKSVRYNRNPDGWNGKYINTFAFISSFTYEHAYIDWYLKPIGNIFTHDADICVGKPVSFTESSNFNPDQWLWNFGDGNTSTDKNPVHTFNNPGNYTIKVSSFNSTDTFTYSKTINVNWCTGININEDLSLSIYPNPAHDYLHIKKGSEKNLNFTIRNINGVVVPNKISFNESGEMISINVANLPSGFYLIEFYNTDFKVTKSFVKF